MESLNNGIVLGVVLSAIVLAITTAVCFLLWRREIVKGRARRKHDLTACEQQRLLERQLNASGRIFSTAMKAAAAHPGGRVQASMERANGNDTIFVRSSSSDQRLYKAEVSLFGIIVVHSSNVVTVHQFDEESLKQLTADLDNEIRYAFIK